MKYVVRYLIPLCTMFGLQAYDCNRWSWDIQAGVAPTVWINRGEFTAVSCNATQVLSLPNAVIPLFNFPQFNHLFHVPWIIETYFSYATDSGLDLFVQFDYRRAKSRTFVIPNLVIPGIDTLSFAIAPRDHYQAIDAFVGLYKQCLLECLDMFWFYGAKVGIVHRSKIDSTFITNSLTVPFENETATRMLIQKNTVPAVGGSLGLTGCICGNFLWRFQIEMVAACGPHITQNIPFDFGTESVLINPLLAPNGFINNGIQTEIYFPVTFGFKYLL
jgi:hypothetical protein